MPVKAAPPPTSEGYIHVGDINYNCGDGASYCPETNTNNTFGGYNFDKPFKSVKGEKPIPVKPGFKFIDWQITSITPYDSYNGTKLKTGNLMSDWDSYTIGNIYPDDYIHLGGSDYECYSLDLTAVWEPLSSKPENTIPVNISVPATPINVTLPASIELVFDGSSPNAIVASNYTITNNSKVGILEAKPEGSTKDKSWSMNSNSTESYYANLPLDSKQIYFGISKDGNNWTSLNKSMTEAFVSLDPQGINGSSNSSQFSIKCMTGGSTSAIDSNLLDLNFVFSYKAVEPDVGSHKVYFDTDGGSAVTPLELLAYNTIDLDDFMTSGGLGYSYKEGFMLTGWSPEKNGEVVKLYPMPNHDITFYAQWEEMAFYEVVVEAPRNMSPKIEIEVPDEELIPNYETIYYCAPKRMTWKEAIESNSVYIFDQDYKEYYKTSDITLNDKGHVVVDNKAKHCALGADINDPFGKNDSPYCRSGE